MYVVGLLMPLVGIFIENEPMKTKYKVYGLLGLLYLIIVLFYESIEHKEEKEKEKKDEFNIRERAKEGLIIRKFSPDYVNGLPDNPFVSNDFNEGVKLSEESRFEDAIDKFEKCLNNPNATESNIVAAHIKIGDCYSNLSRLKEAEDHYKKALKMSRKVKDKNEKINGKAVALACMGGVYIQLVKPHKARKKFKKRLKIAKRTGDKTMHAYSLFGIGITYINLNKYDEGIKKFQETLEIAREIHDDEFIGITMSSIGLAYYAIDMLDEALNYHNQALRFVKPKKELQNMKKKIEYIIKSINKQKDKEQQPMIIWGQAKKKQNDEC